MVVKKKKEHDCKQIIAKYKRLEELEKFRTEFVANIIHDLKNPITSIQGYNEYLLSGKLGKLNDRQKKALLTSKQSLDNLKSLINRILLYHKLEAHKESLNIQKIDIKDIIDNIYDQENIMFEKKNLTLVKDVEKNIPKPRGDPEKIRQVIINLVDNAYKFTNKGAVIISAKKVRNEIEISIKDTGTGIPKGKVKELFKRFSQVGETSKKKCGFGLGLVIIKDILQLHKSKIKLETKQGVGSTFSFRLNI